MSRHYIGSDCIEGFAFRISGRQPASKIHSAQKLFKTGDYLLVRRSLYGSDFRERAPRADFDGICSADILTIREISQKIVDGYLIAVLYSKELWNFIVSNSTGSLTRRIKWSQLKDFEFLLPPEDFQKYIVDLLWAMERTKDAYKALIKQYDELVKSQFVEMFGERFSTCRIKLEQIATSTIGLTYKPENTSDGEGTIVLRSGNIQDGELDIKTDIVRVAGIVIPESKYVHPGDILMCSRNGSASLVGKCCRITECEEEMAFGAFMTVIRSQYPSFLYGFFQSQYFKEQLSNVGTTSINQITTKMLNAYETVMPTMEEEERFSLFLTETDKSKLATRQALESLEKSQKAIMNKVYG